MRPIATLVVAVAVSYLSAPASVMAQRSPESVRVLVQMPVAPADAVRAGARPADVQALAEGLNTGGIGPADFNSIVTESAQPGADPAGMGAFVRQQVEAGVRGEALAQSIHAQLRSRGIPAGGHTGGGPPPIALSKIPPHAREAMARGRGQDDQDDDRAGRGRGRGAGRGAAGGRGSDDADAVRGGVAAAVGPEALGRIGREIFEQPGRVHEILSGAKMSPSAFEARLRAVAQQPGSAAAQYRQGFEGGAARRQGR